MTRTEDARGERGEFRLAFEAQVNSQSEVLSRPLPQRQSLVAQTVGYLASHMEAGQWEGWLPGERSLCESLQIGRNTLRAALAQLQREHRIQPVRGVGNKILVPPSAAPRPVVATDVALLTPLPLERLRPLQTLWIDEMRSLLAERGVRLRVFHEPRFFGPKPGALLQELTSRNPHGCWIVMLSNEAAQQWFSNSHLPCVIAGSTHHGVNLPSRDLDYRAISRHAAGVLLGLGHRRLAMIAENARWAGRLESEAGLQEAAEQSGHPGVRTWVMYHEPTRESVAQVLARLLKCRPTITGVIVNQPYAYLAVATQLAALGWRVPDDISLVSRDDDPALAFITPSPALYSVNPHVMAKSLLKPVLQLLDGKVVSQWSTRIVPTFRRGQSISAPPQRP